MKKYSFLFVIILMIFFVSCKQNILENKPVGKTVEIDKVLAEQEYSTLAEIYNEHGNLINSPIFPPTVSAAEVLEHLNQWLIVDIRNADAYEMGHINGAYNMPKDKVLNFLINKQKAAAYSRVIFVCYSGQMASYVTGITRFAGFDNTFVMRYGMASWNPEFSAFLKKGFGDRYSSMVQKAVDGIESIEIHHNDHKAEINYNKLPKLASDKPYDLMMKQAQKLLNQKRPNFLLKDDEVFPELEKDENAFYTLFYYSKKKYDAAHIKGAHFFKSRMDLGLDNKLTQLPADKPILVYCKSGHTGGNATAYLNMLGYKAHNLMFGAGGFMYSFWKEKEWMGDVSGLINDFPVVEGKKRTNNKLIASSTSKKPASPKLPVKRRKKKEVSGGCG